MVHVVYDALLDEVLDHGYPQNCAVDVLKMYINFGAVKNKLADQAEGLTSQITGAIDWRRPGLSPTLAAILGPGPGNWAKNTQTI